LFQEHRSGLRYDSLFYARIASPFIVALDFDGHRERGKGEGDAANVKTTASSVPQIQDVGFQRIRNRKNDIQFEREREAEGEGYPQFCKTNRGSCFSSAYEIWSLRDSEEAKIDKQPLASGAVDAPEKLERNVGKAQKHERPG
jgi:hypothetical protein